MVDTKDPKGDGAVPKDDFSQKAKSAFGEFFEMEFAELLEITGIYKFFAQLSPGITKSILATASIIGVRGYLVKYIAGLMGWTDEGRINEAKDVVAKLGEAIKNYENSHHKSPFKKSGINLDREQIVGIALGSIMEIKPEVRAIASKILSNLTPEEMAGAMIEFSMMTPKQLENFFGEDEADVTRMTKNLAAEQVSQIKKFEAMYEKATQRLRARANSITRQGHVLTARKNRLKREISEKASGGLTGLILHGYSWISNRPERLIFFLVVVFLILVLLRSKS